MNEPAFNNRMLDGMKLMLPAGVIGVIAIMILPLPAVLLDMLISLNVALSIIILLTALYLRRPVDFSVFPSVLLLLTIFRLALNISSTRRILIHGAEGTSAAGHVIEAFGQFVVGGNTVVGVVMFLILLIIQFVVINHGATRISEVAARFTLDALPGKQMAIDADLNAGIIDEEEARSRREEIQNEADFYGAMDGAVRFTQRDAIASMIIVAINILAGLAIGTIQAGMSLGDAAHTYTVLTVGDGLVSAMPALLVSVSGGMITTRKAAKDRLSGELTGQLFFNSAPLGIAGIALAFMAIIPGMPTFSFLVLAAACGGMSLMGRKVKEAEALAAEEAERPAGPLPEEPIEPLLTVDPLTIEVGYDLVDLAGSTQQGGLLDRIRGIRRQVAMDLGLIVPPVRVRDNLKLPADTYQVLLRGDVVGTARLPRGSVLAINPGDVLERIEGEPTSDPAFGIDALWIPEGASDQARSVGYTVVDRTSVISTHLAELVKKHAPELLSRQDTQRLLDALAKHAPKLVEDLTPERYTLGQIQKVLQALLRERISIRDLQAIGEAMADSTAQDIHSILNEVRRALGRTLVRPLLADGSLKVISLSPEVEAEVQSLLAPGPDGVPAPPDPRVTQSLVQRVAEAVKTLPAGVQPVVVCGSAQSRTILARLAESALGMVPFLSVTEIPDNIRIQAVGQVRQQAA